MNISLIGGKGFAHTWIPRAANVVWGGGEGCLCGVGSSSGAEAMAS
jgi:hypothetical protein